MKARFTTVTLGTMFLFAVLVAGVFATGSTFGQRCSAQGLEPGAAAWQSCVAALARR